MKSIRSTLFSIAGTLPEPEKLQNAVVIGAWRDTVGKTIAMHTKPIEIKENRLIVLVRNDEWKNHLESLASQVVFNLNSAFRNNVVRFVVFRVDRTGKHFENLDEKLRIEQIKRQECVNEAKLTLKDAAELFDDAVTKEAFLAAAGAQIRKSKIES
ncbi:MAG: DciA family protein [Pyrinomonadaceae bacterium]